MKCIFLCVALLLCDSLGGGGQALGQEHDAKPSPWKGEMKEGRVYSADVIYKSGSWWPEGLVIPFHHAVHVGWENIQAFPMIPTRAQVGQRMHWSWKVLSRQVWKVPNRNEWRTSFSCSILRVEAHDAK